jgi:DNA-binding HxlR family transcriptional regulator
MTLLSNKLLKLQYEGLISKKIYSDVSTIVEYKLTGRVSELILILEELGDYSPLQIQYSSIYTNTITKLYHNKDKHFFVVVMHGTYE